MVIGAISTAVSFLAALLLVVLFVHEERAEVRYGKEFRLHLDYYLLKFYHATEHALRHVSADLFRQLAHYLFHTILGIILIGLKHYERKIHDLQRSNRLRARTSRMERTTRNKLDEIAEHKIAVALSEEEKRHRKERHLLGG